MPTEPSWLSFDEVVAINRDVASRTGEPFTLARPALLQDALGRPQIRFHAGETDVFGLTVTLLFALSRDRPFQRSNVRTAFVAAALFLEMNGYELRAPDTELLGDLVDGVIAGRLDEAQFEAVLRPYVVETGGP